MKLLLPERKIWDLREKCLENLTLTGCIKNKESSNLLDIFEQIGGGTNTRKSRVIKKSNMAENIRCYNLSEKTRLPDKFYIVCVYLGSNLFYTYFIKDA